MENEFIYPVDASLYVFKFNWCQEVKVTYKTFRNQDGTFFVMVTAIAMTSHLLREISNNKELVRELEAAARHNAEEYWKNAEQELVESQPVNSVPL